MTKNRVKRTECKEKYIYSRVKFTKYEYRNVPLTEVVLLRFLYHRSNYLNNSTSDTWLSHITELQLPSIFVRLVDGYDNANKAMLRDRVAS